MTDTFQQAISEIENKWSNLLNYPIRFDVENVDAKIYISHKNYCQLHHGKIKLTGATLHAADKPKIAEKNFKSLMETILPNTFTKEDFISKYRELSVKIVKESFVNIKIEDLVMASGIQPAENYQNDKYATRVTVLENLLNLKITFPTKIEFIVCKKKLPNVEGEKSDQDPIAYEWPRQLVEDTPEEWDIEWYKRMVYSYLETIVSFPKGTLRMNLKSLFGEYAEQPTFVQMFPELRSATNKEIDNAINSVRHRNFFDDFDEADLNEFMKPSSPRHIPKNDLDEFGEDLDEMIMPEILDRPKVNQRKL